MNKLEVGLENETLQDEYLFESDEVKFITPEEAYYLVKESQREVVARLMEETFKQGKTVVELPFKLLNTVSQELMDIGWNIGIFHDSIYWKDSLPEECEKKSNSQIEK